MPSSSLESTARRRRQPTARRHRSERHSEEPPSLPCTLPTVAAPLPPSQSSIGLLPLDAVDLLDAAGCRPPLLLVPEPPAKPSAIISGLELSPFVPPCLFLLATDATTGPPLFFLAEIRHSNLSRPPSPLSLDSTMAETAISTTTTIHLHRRSSRPLPLDLPSLLPTPKPSARLLLCTLATLPCAAMLVGDLPWLPPTKSHRYASHSISPPPIVSHRPIVGHPHPSLHPSLPQALRLPPSSSSSP